jgi:hypothetical protein
VFARIALIRHFKFNSTRRIRNRARPEGVFMKLFASFRNAVAAAAALLAASALISSAWADPPGRVARLAEYAGDVQLSNGRDGWQPVQRNYPITSGDNVWVSDGSRAELDVGMLTVWLSGGANVYFEQFDDQRFVARLASGAVAVRVREWDTNDAMRVATPHGEVALLQPGLYVITAGRDYAPSVLSNRFGQAELNTFGRAQIVNRGEVIAFDNNGARFDRYANNYASGGFDAWVSARDRRIERWESRNRGTLNAGLIGVRDLDDHGYWDSHYEYGRVWYPTAVSAGWAPYRNGRWSHVQPWGWTWIDDAPWGFAPFHYGRWVRVGGRWAWCPGQYTTRAVYAPALVTFFGGNGWSLSVGSAPAFSWVPLGWNEPYAPWYTYSPTYWRHVNRPYVRYTNEDPWRPPTYIHASHPGAVTAVAAATFISGRHVGSNHIRNVAVNDVRSAPPARMGEVIPQFERMQKPLIQGQPAPYIRSNDPNPIVRGQAVPSALPPVRVDPNPVVRSTGPAAQPAPNVAPARPYDPNPIVRTQPAPNQPQQQPQFQPPAPTRSMEVPPASYPGNTRPADPNPVTRSAPAVQPLPVPQVQVAPQPVQQAQPQSRPAPVAPNTNVMQPRVWQDPNPIAGSRQTVAPAPAQNPAVVPNNQPAPPVNRNERNERNERVLPSLKDRRDAAPGAEPRSDLQSLQPAVAQTQRSEQLGARHRNEERPRDHEQKRMQIKERPSREG